MAYTIEFYRQAERDLKEYSRADQLAIIQKIREQLVTSPFPHGKTIKKLQGFDIAIYRLRINASQSYRLFYQILEHKVLILRIVSKKDSEKVIKILKKYL